MAGKLVSERVYSSGSSERSEYTLIIIFWQRLYKKGAEFGVILILRLKI